MEYLQSIKEVSYLIVGNVSRYRRIMRIFFKEYEKMKFNLYKEDVFGIIKTFPDFENYTMEQLKSDLDYLVECGNLITIQDPKQARTIEEYKNKQFRYSMSEYAVEIERLTIRLETLLVEGGNLSTNAFLRINEAIGKIESVNKMSLRDIYEWWHDLQEDFKNLNQNYKDYLREFYSGNADKILKSVEFIIHKDKFIKYLKNFISELKINSNYIEKSFKLVSEASEKAILEKVIKSELEVPRPITGSNVFLEENIRENIYGKWNAFKRWFVSNDEGVSESNRIMDITDEIIRKIVQNASLILQLQNWGVSRKNDYIKFIKMFIQCENMSDAHKLSAHIFGIQNIRHYKINSERSTDSINSSTYEEEPAIYSLESRTRKKYKSKTEKTGFEDKSGEKIKNKENYLKQIEHNKNMVMKYIKDNKIELSEIDDVISESTRLTLLKWISEANLSDEKVGMTEFGQSFELIKGNESCVLKCEDGELIMPAYILKFKED